MVVSPGAESRWLIDKSALVRLPESADGEEWLGRIERGLIHILPIVITIGVRPCQTC